ncbi:MAG: hypothetical protein ICV77_09820 [Cyanobacteria bacterium Co-bin8]|nr:hypothetical protein [Cyanobacteria bacterium Co-bin8]
MDAFSPIPPNWTESAVHTTQFRCPRCGAETSKAQSVWINRRSPVYTENHRRKWQEFYHCECSTVWWAWSSDRPVTNLGQAEEE